MPPGRCTTRYSPPMHELSVCQSLISQVETLARERHAKAVRSIRVAMGPLAGVDPGLLERAYPLACAGTIAEAAELVIVHLPLRVHCDRCGLESDAVPDRLICGGCGDWHTRLVSGDEMLLTGVELVVETEPDSPAHRTAGDERRMQPD